VHYNEQKGEQMKQKDLSIGTSFPPFIIAEMSGNHNQSIERALEIVDIAADCGVQALKIQTYTADTMTIQCDRPEFVISNPKSLWHGRSLYELYQEAYTPWEWHRPIFERCKERGLLGFSTPFDASSVDFLESLDVPCYKIASFENTDLPLIEKVAKTGKPLIISTGMATLADLEQLVNAFKRAGGQGLVLLKCTSSYPASPLGTNLNTIPHMKAMFGCEVGLSDHTLGVGVSVASVALGATVIEKHFTLSRAEGGVDAAFSMEPHEMKDLVRQTKQAWEALGHISYGPSEEEKGSLVFRRSIYAVEDIVPGEALTEKNVRIIRPGLGLAPKYWQNVLGKVAVTTIKRGTALNWALIRD
jgi:N-acetylneuraminate synthase